MADAAGAGTAKEAIELLEKLKALVGESASPTAAELMESSWSEVTGPVSAADVSNSYVGAVAAVERFRSTMRWLVGVTGVIALVLFGSTAFTSDIPFDEWRVWTGLGLAAAGLVAVFYSVTRVMEPEDSSLGELLSDIKSIKTSYPPLRGREKSVQNYLEILHVERNEEPETHVKNLITSIVQGMQDRVGPAKQLAQLRTKLKELEAEIASVDARRTALTTSLIAITSNDKVPAADKVLARTRTLPLISQAANRISDLEDCVAAIRNDVLTKASDLQSTDVPLRTQLFDRELIINEYGVVQIRGTFREARWWLLFGAVLTLAGTILYLTALKAEDDSTPSESGGPVALLLPGTLELSANDDAFVAVQAECKAVQLDVLFGSLELPAPKDPYTVTVVSPDECVGDYTIPKDTTGDTLTVETP